jgi:hypothetical protein
LQFINTLIPRLSLRHPDPVQLPRILILVCPAKRNLTVDDIARRRREKRDTKHIAADFLLCDEGVHYGWDGFTGAWGEGAGAEGGRAETTW